MPSFNPEPFEEFLAAHVGESWRRVEVRRAVLPVLQDLVERDYAFRPLVVGDLDRLRADLQALFGFAVRDVRTVSIEAVLAPLPDESDEARAKRVEASVNAIDDQHIDLSDLLNKFET